MQISSLFDVSGKTALVSGGGRGIGAMITKALVANGARVIVVSRAPGDVSALLPTADMGSVEMIVADLSSEQECARVADLIRSRYQQLHILVNNSGCNWGAPLLEYPYAAFEKVFRLNVFGVFSLIKQLIPILEQSSSESDPARIVNIGSVNGVAVPHLETYAYSSSKAALHMLTKTLASRLAKKHITVNAILPGPFLTRMTAQSLSKADQAFLRSVPIGRLGHENDIAGAILYLTSKASNYVTGALIPVDGGALISPKM